MVFSRKRLVVFGRRPQGLRSFASTGRLKLHPSSLPPFVVGLATSSLRGRCRLLSKKQMQGRSVTRNALACFSAVDPILKGSGGISDPEACGSKLTGFLVRACELARRSPWDGWEEEEGSKRRVLSTSHAYPDVVHSWTALDESEGLLQLEMWPGSGCKWLRRIREKYG